MKVDLNLLPAELTAQTKKQKRLALLNNISIVVIAILIAVTALIIGFSFLETTTGNQINDNIVSLRNKINNYKKNEEVLFVLKSRLDGIRAIFSKESIHAQSFNLIYALAPDGVKINSFNVDKSGKVALSTETKDLAKLEVLLDNLTNPQKNEGRIKSTTLESLQQRENGKIYMELVIVVTEGREKTI